jgi:competence protein ComEC
METKTQNLLVYLILPLFLLTSAVFIANKQATPDYLMHVDFLDVGQGDSMFIQTYLGNQIVIDGGPSDKVLSELSKKMPFWDHTIDMLILTHPDADHSAGLIDVLKRYEVKKVMLTKMTASTATYQQFIKLVDEEGAEKIYAEMGQRIWLDSATVFDVLYPPSGVENSGLSTNNTGIIGKLTFGKTKVLFTADDDTIIEDTIRSEFDLHADILKVGHHGSKYSNSLEFIKAVAPRYGVIEVGANNTYGHPTEETLGNLAAANVEVFRTDLNKTIEFTSDGFSLVKK